MSAQNSRIYSIQAGRGIAAIMVVIYHCYIIMKQPEYGGHYIFKTFSEFGLLGVNFFFVLSGFIILMAHKKDIGKNDAAAKYATKRAFRIYPVYWIWLLCYIIAGILGFGHPDFSNDLGSFLNAITLIWMFPQEGALPLKVAWTLFYEVQFYILFISFIYSRALGIIVFSIWSALILLDLMGVAKFGHISSAWNIHFLLGMLAYVMYERMKANYGVSALIIGISLLLSLVYYQIVQGNDMKNLRSDLLVIAAISFSFIVYAIASIEKQRSVRVASFWKLLGDASYSIYLIHSAAISATLIVIKKIGLMDYIPKEATFIALAISSTIAGLVCYLIVEKSIMANLGKFNKK